MYDQIIYIFLNSVGTSQALNGNFIFKYSRKNHIIYSCLLLPKLSYKCLKFLSKRNMIDLLLNLNAQTFQRSSSKKAIHELII